ncbi:MAG TPA: prepilin-type N-terminal cleavage/methylation domain-containing protein [Trueperaceae bacterium]
MSRGHPASPRASPAGRGARAGRGRRTSARGEPPGHVARGRRGPARGLASPGLSLVEVLIALAVASLLLAAVTGVLGSAKAAGDAEERAAEPRRALDLAAELLAEDVGLAGHAPFGLAGGAASPGLVVRSAPAGHAVSVAFVDDRLSGPAAARLLTFEAGADARGVPQLYRASGVGSRQPLVEGVAGLAVEAVVDGAGALRAPAPGETIPDARAVVLRLTAADAEERVAVVLLGARPTVEVRP